MVASLPLQCYRQQPGDLPSVKAPMSQLLQSPSAYGTVYDWLHQMMTSLILQGNAWGYITARDGYGFPVQVEWLPAEHVTVVDDEQQGWNPMRARIYFMGREMLREELFHIRAFTVPGKLAGLSPLRLFMTLITSGNDALEYGASWYRAGGFPPGTFQNQEETVDAEQSAEIRRRLSESIRRREPLVYGRDWDYKPVAVPPSEAQFIEAMQLNATQIAAVLGIPPERIGGARGDSLTYCADMQTQLLSRRGWLNADEVEVGDACLTLNTETGMAEWQPVKAVNIFAGPHGVTVMRNRSHSSVTTATHRWPVMLDASTGRNAAAGWQWRTTATLPSDARIAAAVPVVAPTEAKWSDALVEALAWYWTEGWTGRYDSITITQSDKVNPENVARIRAALTGIFGPASTVGQVRAVPAWVEDREPRGMARFRLNAKAGRILSEHAPDKVVSTEFLSELTQAQLELFIRISIDADGTWRPGGREAVMAQKDIRRVEAFQVACALAGRSGVVNGPNKAGMFHMSIQASPWRKPAGHAEYITHTTIDEPVWCPTTENGTWFARRDGTTYFTGNSTVEQESISLLTDTLRPWLVRIETALFSIMPQSQYARFQTHAMLKTTTEARYSIYNLSRTMGIQTANEIRALEELPPLPGTIGDDPLPLSVLVSMTRGIDEIPKSMNELLVAGPAQEAMMASNEKVAASQPAPVIVPGPQGSPGRDGQPGQNGNGTGAQAQPANGQRPGTAAQGEPAAAAAAARARWPGDYDGPPPGEKLNGNGRSR